MFLCIACQYMCNYILVLLCLLLQFQSFGLIIKSSQLKINYISKYKFLYHFYFEYKYVRPVY